MTPVRNSRQRVDPLMVTLIENNVLLTQVRDDVKDMAKKQDENHVVTLALKEHATIERVDNLWEDLGQMKFLIHIIVGLVLLVPALTFTHLVFRWP